MELGAACIRHGQSSRISCGINGLVTSMRRTKVAEIYRKTGNLCAVQLLLGHTKVDSTVRYLGVELEDALSISEPFVISKRSL